MTTLKTQLKNATKAALIATFAVTGLYAATNTPALAGERFTDFFTMGVYDYDRKWNQLITENSVDPAGENTETAMEASMCKGSTVEECPSWARAAAAQVAALDSIPPVLEWSWKGTEEIQTSDDLLRTATACYGLGTSFYCEGSEEENSFELEEQIAFEPPFCYTPEGYVTYCSEIRRKGLPVKFYVNIESDTRVAFEPPQRCYMHAQKRWTTCNRFFFGQNQGDTDAETQVAMGWVLYVENDAQDDNNADTQVVRKRCYGLYREVPCPSNIEELSTFDEEKIAFDKPDYNPDCTWRTMTNAWGVEWQVCKNSEELNAFDAEEQIVRGNWINMNVFNRCEKKHGIAYCLKHRYYNTEELNAFDAQEQIAFNHELRNKCFKLHRMEDQLDCLANGLFGNADEIGADALIAEGAQCVWQGYTVDCDSLDADAQVIAGANPYTQDANPADTVDATSQHLLAGADDDYELQLTK